jgi:hypothetical protein
MGETTDQIEEHIQSKRGELQSNLEELESKVKSAVDWRQYFHKYTGTMVAAAFGAGMLLSAVSKRRRSTESAPAGEERSKSNARPPISCGA